MILFYFCFPTVRLIVFPSAEDKRNTNNFLKTRHQRKMFLSWYPFVPDQMTNFFRAKENRGINNASLRSWRDFALECFCFGSEAVNASGKAVRGLVKSPVEHHRSPAHESRQLRRLKQCNRQEKHLPAKTAVLLILCSWSGFSQVKKNTWICFKYQCHPQVQTRGDACPTCLLEVEKSGFAISWGATENRNFSASISVSLYPGCQQDLDRGFNAHNRSFNAHNRGFNAHNRSFATGKNSLAPRVVSLQDKFLLKCHYDEILDIHFFTFSCRTLRSFL